MLNVSFQVIFRNSLLYTLISGLISEERQEMTNHLRLRRKKMK